MRVMTDRTVQSQSGLAPEHADERLHVASYSEFQASEQSYQQQIAELWERLKNQMTRLEDAEARASEANRSSTQRLQYFEGRLSATRQENLDLQQVLQNALAERGSMAQRAQSAEVKLRAEESGRERECSTNST